MKDQGKLDSLWQDLRKCGPTIAYIIDDLAQQLIGGRPLREGQIDKKFNDPIWKTITLRPVEVRLLDMKLMQRLRRVRQLGLAYLVYPSAQHSRFEHSLGAVHVADRMARMIEPITEERFLRAIRIAALLHDSGHTAFSHVGERALMREPRFRQSFSAAKDLLNKFFDDPARDEIERSLANPTDSTASKSLVIKGPPAAEIISALLTLSPTMSLFAQSVQLSQDDLLRSASLILGRPYQLSTVNGQAYADYVKSLVSSDLDADKLDYVARDAYVTGIPIAADVERLMSQLTLVDCRLSGNRPMNNCKILAILPSGVSAVEMFIMTRAYLFNRVYQHPKIRLAEAILERRLHDVIQSRVGAGDLGIQGVQAVFDLLYGINGDDACLEMLDRDRGNIPRISEQWRSPRRVLALSPRLVHGYDQPNGQPNRLLAQVWSPAATQIQQNSSIFESAVAKILGVHASKIVVDWQRQANIKENPAVYVADQFQAGRLIPLSEAFDIGQLARAYEDVKSIAWVFADCADSAQAAAAAAAIASTNLFGLVPTREAVAQAKIDPSAFISALESLPIEPLDKFAAKQVANVISGKLAVPHAMVRSAFNLPEEDALLMATRLAAAFNASLMHAAQFHSISAAITVAGLVVDYMDGAAQRQPRHSLEIDEAKVQREVIDWLGHRLANSKDIRVRRETSSPAGRVDLEVATSRGSTRIVPIEMKAEQGKFETVVRRNIAQPFQYLTNTPYEHVGVLLCRFRAHDERRQANLVRVEFASSGDPPTAVICIGQHVPPHSASETRAAGETAKRSGRRRPKSLGTSTP